MIQKFSPHPAASTSNHRSINRPKITAEPSDTVKSTHHRLKQFSSSPDTTKPVVKAMSSRELKQSLIAESLQKATPTQAQNHKPAKRVSFLRRPLKTSSIMAGALAIVILGGYMTYVSMPGISTRVAASQAGIDASYPGYSPDGYRFKGPVAYGNGEVTISFSSNGGPQNYTINQKKSNWDSQTVLDSFVMGQSSDYNAHTSQGVTVYTYQDGAAWINGGILYTLEGDATLSTEQVLRIANSM